MQFPFFQVDAFTSEAFKGNPAAVIILTDWIQDDLMQKIAAENNISETAFLVKQEDEYAIRWFTPVCEVDLCGHATLAAAHVLFHELRTCTSQIIFHSDRSGKLRVQHAHDLNGYILEFPADTLSKSRFKKKQIEKIIGCTVLDLLDGKSDVLVRVKSEKQVKNLQIDFQALAELNCRGIIVTAEGKAVDFVSRWFGPRVGILEDPVTGSAHTSLTPYWAYQLQKTTLKALQLSKRGGELECSLEADIVSISGNAVTVIKGEFVIPSNDQI